MKGTALVFRAGQVVTPGQPIATARQFDQPVSLKFLRDAVGGHIEAVPGWTQVFWDGQLHDCAAFCNEEGKLNGLPLNRRATYQWHEALLRVKDEKGQRIYPRGLRRPDGGASDVLCGDIVVVFGDAEFMDEL